MPRKGFRAEEVIAKLREADVLLGQGKRVAEVKEWLVEMHGSRIRRSWRKLQNPRPFV